MIMTIGQKQDLADKFTNETLTAIYGERFTSLNDVEDDDEINNMWEYLNREFYEVITNVNNETL